MGKINLDAFKEDSHNSGTCAQTSEDKKQQCLKRVEVRKELIGKVSNAAEALKELQLTHMAAKLVQLAASTRRNSFSVAFVGEFSHGKSTLINSLLDQEMLPVGDLPTTAMLTRIITGEKEEIIVTDRSGKPTLRLPLSQESWTGLTADVDEGTKVNEGMQGIVTITTPNKWLKTCAINILDTPGANDGSKNRDVEISRALLATDGAIICMDVQRGVLESQKAFIRDKILSAKVPFVAIALTHLDVIAPERRERQILYIVAELKRMNANVPVLIPSEVNVPSLKGVQIVTGINSLRSMLASWATSPDRCDRMEEWLKANVRGVLALASEALIERKEVLAANDADRQKLVIEKKGEITAHHEAWEKLRAELEVRCNETNKEYMRRLAHEKKNVEEAMLYYAETMPDPGKWYRQHYAYQLSNRMSASIVSLDNYVTERARADFEWLNRELAKSFKTQAERDSKVWGKTEEKSDYVHTAAPELADISGMQQKSGTVTAFVASGGALLGSILFGVGGLIGSVGAGTAARFIAKRKIDNAIDKDRSVLMDYIKDDVGKVLSEATFDSSNRIRLLYSDMLAAALKSESLWMKTQHELIEMASRPSAEASAKALAELDGKISLLAELSETL